MSKHVVNPYTFSQREYCNMYWEMYGWLSVTTDSFLNARSNKKRQKLFDEMLARYQKFKQGTK